MTVAIATLHAWQGASPQHLQCRLSTWLCCHRNSSSGSSRSTCPLGGSPEHGVQPFLVDVHACMHACSAQPMSANPHSLTPVPLRHVLQPMGSNYFLWIIVIVSVLAVLSWALGYI